MTTSNQEEDVVLSAITEYALDPGVLSDDAYDTARWDLMDALGSGLLALRYPQCTKLLGPWTPGTSADDGARVPGTAYQLDPIQAAFSLGTMIRWLDYNDTWLAAEWGHPSDNLGAILPTADWISRRRMLKGRPPLTIKDVLTAMIQAHEIQGVLALENSLNRAGMDHVLFVKIASTAVVTALLGGSRQEVFNAVSNAWLDNGPLRTYRHAPNTGSRKSWAAGDAASRAVHLAFMALRGEMGYPNALTAPGWGFQDAMLGGTAITLPRALGSYVMENVLFKVNYPAEFHGQTAVEAAITLHPLVKDRIDQIAEITITTQESAKRIIDKTGPLKNPADRDHCIQYMVAVGLLEGTLTAEHYEDAYALSSRVDQLRTKMTVVEEPRYSRDYLDPDKRSIANAVHVRFENGSETRAIEVEYPVGHRRRRAEAIPLLEQKFRYNALTAFPVKRVDALSELFRAYPQLAAMSVPDFVDQWVLQEWRDVNGLA